MLNVDNRILSMVDASEMWLLLQIVKRLNKEMFCFPSNKSLLTDTGWSIEKLQKIKKSLRDKGFLKIESRYNSDRQTSNIYYLTTDLVGAYIGGDQLSRYPPEKNHPMTEKTGMASPPEEQTTEVLSSKELSSTIVEGTELKEEFSGDTVEDLYTTITGKKVMPDRPKRKAAREKKEKRVDEFYQPFVSAWCEAYPDLGFNAISGKKIKDIIRDTKWWMTAAGKEVTPESATNMFKYILDYVKRTPHFAHGKPITTFAGQYLSIIKEIKEGKPAGQQRPASGSIFSKYQ